MPRCYICDYSSDTDKGTKKVEWDDAGKGFLCEECKTAIDDAIYEHENDEDLGGLAILEECRDEEAASKDRRDHVGWGDSSPSELESGNEALNNDTT